MLMVLDIKTLIEHMRDIIIDIALFSCQQSISKSKQITNNKNSLGALKFGELNHQKNIHPES